MTCKGSVVNLQIGNPPTLPLVQSTASLNWHSLSDTGLDKGKMMGRGLSSAILSMTSRVNAPRVVDNPKSAVGLTYSTISRRSFRGGPW